MNIQLENFTCTTENSQISLIFDYLMCVCTVHVYVYESECVTKLLFKSEHFT